MPIHVLPTRWARSFLVSLSILLLLLSVCHAQNRSTEAGEAAIKDPNLECQPYSYPPVSNSLASFPPIWQPATILPNDAAAMNLWNSIAGSVPSSTIPVKGTLNGDFGSSMSNYPASDPDCWWSFSHCVSPKKVNLLPDISRVPEPRTLGYGFDDGPSCSHNIFYDFLQSQNQKATMFFIGSNVMNSPLEAQRAQVDGHEICVHSWSHRYMTAFSSQGAFAELYYTIKAFQLVIGITPTCWRPPYGDVDDRIRSIATALGLRTVMWNYDSSDWHSGIGGVTPADVDHNYQSLIDAANSGQFNNSGAIILTHELNNFTMSEAIKFYPKLKAVFQMLPVGQAMNLSFTLAQNNTGPGNSLIPGTSNNTSTTNATSTMSTSTTHVSTTSTLYPTAKNSATTLDSITIIFFLLILFSTLMMI